MFLLISVYWALKKFYPIFIATEIIIPYGIHPFDICAKNPLLWKYIKILFLFTYIFSNIIILNSFYNKFIYNLFNKKIPKKNNNKFDTNKLHLFIGNDFYSKEKIIIPETGLYQNFFITGTIGSGKTSSAM